MKKRPTKNSRLLKKLRSQSGTSIGEMLVVTVIVLLVSGVLVSGIQLALRQYQKSVILSEEKILASSLSNIIEGELSVANTDLMKLDDSGKLVTFRPKNYGLEKSDCGFYSVSVSDNHQVSKASDGFGELFLGSQNSSGVMSGHLLLSRAAYSQYSLKASVDVSFADEIFHVVLTIKDPTDVTSVTEFDVLSLYIP